MTADERSASPPLDPTSLDPSSLDRAGERVDPELLALPAAPRGPRLATLGLMAVVGAFAVVLLGQLRVDVAYFFSSGRPADLGSVLSLDPAELPVDAYVRVTGTPLASATAEYERGLGAERRAVFPLAGQRLLLVDVPVPADGGDPAARRDFSGRLLTFARAGGRYEAVRRHFADVEGMPVTRETFLLVADAPPSSYGGRLALAVFCLLVLLVDAWLLLRWFRPLP